MVGQRLGLVVGSALSAAALVPGAERRAVDGGEGRTGPVLDAGHVVVLARHGLDRFVPAHLVDHHANVAALCAAGCDRVVATASVGSLHPDLRVGSVLVPDDVLALGVAPTYVDDERGHRVPTVDGPWRVAVLEAWSRVSDRPARHGGTYAMTSGPRFETPAEIRFLAAHADVVGMTVPAELFLAGEAGLAYAAVCQVDNLANGLEADPLALDGYHANVAGLAERLLDDLRALTTDLAGRPRP